MNRSSHRRHSSSADAESPSSAATKPGLGRRVTGWTNNLLASAIVILIGLTLGVGAIKTWRGGGRSSTNDEANASQPDWSPRPTEWTEISTPSGTAQRRSFVGDSQAALATMTERCRGMLDDRQSWPAFGPVGEREGQLIEWSRGKSAVAQQEGRWRIFALDGPVPMVVTMVTVEAVDAESNGPDASELQQRVLCWAIALPQAFAEPDADNEASPGGNRRAQWTLFTFRTGGSNSVVSPLVDLRLPAASQSTLNLTTEFGGVMRSFACPQPVSACQQHFDRQLPPAEWHSGTWQQGSRGASKRWKHEQRGTLEIHLQSLVNETYPAGATVGMILVTPNSTEGGDE